MIALELCWWWLQILIKLGIDYDRDTGSINDDISEDDIKTTTYNINDDISNEGQLSKKTS